MKIALRYISPILILVAGLPVMMAVSSIVPDPKVAQLAVLLAFVVYNIFCGFLTGINEKLRSAWSVRKIWHLIPGLCFGFIPIGLSYFWLHFQGSLPPYKGVTVLVSAFTFATVAWEELWFRGAALELGGKRYSEIGAALAFGFVFASLHLMNPKIDLLHDGFQLVLAGYALSICYFAFGSIYAPVGMHFANNWTQAAFGNSTEPRTMMYTGPLIIIALILTFLLLRKTRTHNSRV